VEGDRWRALGSVPALRTVGGDGSDRRRPGGRAGVHAAAACRAHRGVSGAIVVLEGDAENSGDFR